MDTPQTLGNSALLRDHTTLRHLDLDLEEPVGGICGAHPRRIRHRQ